MIGIKFAIVYGESSDQHHHIMEEAKEYFDTVLGVPLESLQIVYNDGIHLRYRNTDLNEFDCVFLRLFGSDVLYGENIPEILENAGVYTQMDVDSYTIASNKFYMMKILSEGGLPVPPTTYTLSTQQTEQAAEGLGYPVVIKLISGYGGKGVMKADTKSDLTPIIDTLTVFEQDICLQEYIENPGEDIRVIVIGEDTYAYKRIGGDEEFRSNVSAGGDREPFDLPDEIEDTAIQAARAAGFDFCGVDILEGENGEHYIGEINASPGIAGTEEVIGTNIASELVEFLYEKTVDHQSI